MGGDPCIAGTRVPVWLLVESRQLGLSDEEILRVYPSLGAGDLLRAWSYYDAHRDEIHRQIRAHQKS